MGVSASKNSAPDPKLILGLRSVREELHAGRLDEARQQLQRLGEMYRGHPLLLMLSALVSSEGKNYPEAVEAYETVIAVASDHDLVIKAHQQLAQIAQTIHNNYERSLIHQCHAGALDLWRKFDQQRRNGLSDVSSELLTLVGVLLVLETLGEGEACAWIWNSLDSEKYLDNALVVAKGLAALKNDASELGLKQTRALHTFPLVARLYDTLTPFYDTIVGSSSQYWARPASLVECVIPHLPASGMLFDLGCATGGVLKAWKQLGGAPRSWVGVDVASTMLDEARAQGYQRVLQADGLDMMLNGAFYDLGLVIASGVIPYIPQIEVFAQAAFKALRPSGVLAFDTLTLADETRNPLYPQESPDSLDSLKHTKPTTHITEASGASSRRDASIRERLPGFRLVHAVDDVHKALQRASLEPLSTMNGVIEGRTVDPELVWVGYGAQRVRAHLWRWFWRKPGLDDAKSGDDDPNRIIFTRNYDSLARL